jgi:hypothetical protein
LYVAFFNGADMSTDNPAEQFANEEVPIIIRPLFPSALRRAYSAADISMERDPYLASPEPNISVAI